MLAYLPTVQMIMLALWKVALVMIYYMVPVGVIRFLEASVLTHLMALVEMILSGRMGLSRVRRMM